MLDQRSGIYNNMMFRPSIPIPDPLRGCEIGTFAHKTVTVRMPDTVRRVITENDFSPEVVGALETLLSELPNGVIRPLRDRSAPDLQAWEGYVKPFLGQTWLEVPWFFAETYLFRRILEASGYFEPGAFKGIDPFSYQKRTALEVSRNDIRILIGRLRRGLERGTWNPETFERLLHADLWGNQADLNLWPADEEGRPRHADADVEREHLLADDTELLLAHLSRLEAGRLRVDLIADNAGLEFVCDLALSDYLLTSRVAEVVNLHLKMHPTFVSDTIPENVGQTISFLREDENIEVQKFGERVQAYLDRDRLRLHADPYWTSPLSGWEMPDVLRQELSGADLLISKGDANYRRLLGDRHWPYSTPFDEIVSYLPAPLIALRTLKSEVAAGIDAARLETLASIDPDWLIDGKWGVIQFGDPACHD